MTASPTNAPSEPSNRPLRLGVVRAANASPDVTVAEMEARVVRAELERRLGAVTFDLRTDGPTTGPWLPRAHAAWPADIDAMIELDDLGDRAGHLVALFGRTVEPVAADVRSRMLHHLEVLPLGDTVLTDDLLDDLLPSPARPTDVWLVVRSASNLATSEPAHQLLRADADGGDTGALDHWFDDVVAGLPTDTTATVSRLRTEVDELRARLDAALDELTRSEREALERVEDLTTDRDSLRERLDRAQLDPAGGPPP